jgi:hypothetical protein
MLLVGEFSEGVMEFIGTADEVPLAACPKTAKLTAHKADARRTRRYGCLIFSPVLRCTALL